MRVRRADAQEIEGTLTTSGVRLLNSLNLVVSQEVCSRIGFDRHNFAIVIGLKLHGQFFVIRLLRAGNETFNVSLAGLRANLHD